MVIPKEMRAEILGHIHSSHLGAESCLHKERDIVYWPHMNTDIKEVGKCAVCNEFADNQQREPLISHEIPSRPWSKLGINICTVNKKDYLVTVDYYSDYWEVDRLHTTTTAAVFKKLKAHFSRLGPKVKVGVLRPVQQPGSYWDRSSELPLVGLEPTEVTAYD